MKHKMVHYKNEQVKATRHSLDKNKKTLYYTDFNTIITFFKIMWHSTIILLVLMLKLQLEAAPLSGMILPMISKNDCKIGMN